MKKRKKNHSEINYWQSNTDLMTGLVLVLMLIIMLLLLYLSQIPDDTLPDADPGNSYNVDDMAGDTTNDAYRYPDENDLGEEEDETEEQEEEAQEELETDGGGGDAQEDIEDQYEYPYPSSSGEDWSKAAVYATVVDEETGRAIREAGITFELYEEQREGDGGAKRFLNTYYPIKTEYRSYETTDAGVFYLPEKIEEGHYYFKQITDLEGYDTAEAVHFDVDDIYDWSDPYVVSIAVSPSKNIIPISLKDVETHEPIQGGTFEIKAAEDILTMDETVRYAENDTADTVNLNEEGYGESKELYLGNYTITQGTIPQYYASIKESPKVEVEKKSGSVPETVEFFCEKTKIKLSLCDELYTNIKLSGVEFALVCQDEPEFTQTAQTDENGEIIFTDLEKDKIYVLQQVNALEDYKYEDTGTEIFVDEEGRINSEPEISLDFTNYIPRVSVEVRDILFNKPVSNASLALYSKDGQLIRTWTSGGSPEIVEELSKGAYYVTVNGKEDSRYEFEVSGDEALQKISLKLWTAENIAVIVVGAAIGGFGIFAVTFLLKKRHTRNRRGLRKEIDREK